MSSEIFKLVKAMTPFPHSIEASADVAQASELMAQHSIRHLAVMEGIEIVGVISERDLALVATLSEQEDVTVGRICSRPAYVVPLDARLHEVIATMADRRLGCALVTNKGKLVGILTTTDVCRLCADKLRNEYPGGPPSITA